MLCAVRVESDVDQGFVKVGLGEVASLLYYTVAFTPKIQRDVREGNTKGLVHGGREIFYGNGEKRLQRADI